ncbi:MAG: permease [Eubacteriales bacterium]|nr:permease [Eubacteriales bacterium]MDD3537404.1 permease [Eubacteriales bacterium]NLV70701.1 permease [Clostridiales bacterium]HPF19588.1 permease [Bacillota bacterium]HRV32947.1 permease [Anaerovoracaceae bacterium]
MATILTIYTLLAAGLALSLIKSKEKTKKAFKIAGKGFYKSAPSLLAVLGIVGLTLGVLTPEMIAKLVGAEAGFAATILASVIGAITLIPSLVAFPLAGSLLRSGATVMTISAFVTTLVMVGIVTAPLEIKEIGKKFTFLRNGLGFLAALAIAGIMGVLLS